MKTYKRVCIQNTERKAENGDCQTLQRGEKYITSEVNSEGMITVFSAHWEKFPVTLFAGEILFTKA